MTEISLHVPLDKPPQAISLTVRYLLERVRAGAIRIPKFQRPLRWKSSDIIKLFDSMKRGYPIGALLFWKREAPEDSDYRLGGASFPVKKQADAWWIVDGQQRVTALAASLMELGSARGSQWEIYFDPATEDFHSGLIPSHEISHFVPMEVLGDLRRLGRWLRDARLTEAEIDVVENTQQRILDYQLSAYILETEKPEALRGVFARMNSTGVRMRADEVFQALLGESSRPKGGLDLTSLQASCDIDGFGQPPRSEVLKSVLAMSGIDPTRRPEELPEQALQKIVGFDDAEAALLSTIRFLQAAPDSIRPGAGIPCFALLPYPVVFVILSRWFYVHQEPDALLLRELARWVWTSVITGLHERAEVSKLRKQIREIKGEDAGEDLEALREMAGSPRRVDWTLERFHSRSARSRVEILALLTLKPQHQTGPVSWRALMTGGERIAREIYTTHSLRNESEDIRATARTVANRVLSDARHTGLSGEFGAWDADSDHEALASHLLDQEFEHLRTGDVERVLRGRAGQIQAHISAFLNARAGLGEPVLSNRESYFDQETYLDDELGDTNG